MYTKNPVMVVFIRRRRCPRKSRRKYLCCDRGSIVRTFLLASRRPGRMPVCSDHTQQTRIIQIQKQFCDIAPYSPSRPSAPKVVKAMSLSDFLSV